MFKFKLSKFQIILITATISTVLLYGFLYFSGALRSEQAVWSAPSFNKDLTILDSFKISRKNVPFKILFWTKWYGEIVEDKYWVAETECEEDFIVTSDKSELSEADIIVFQYVDLLDVTPLLLESIAKSNSTNISWWPHPRRENVPWVLALQEAPLNVKPLKWMLFDKVFNWTWSYNTTSEIRPAFREMYRRHRHEKTDDKWIYGSSFSSEFLRNKLKHVAWVVSNCDCQPSLRNELIHQLKRHGVQVDTFGKCRKNSSCPDGDDCFKELGKTYKFYFAGENSLCLNYITEKIHNGLRHGLVPIVYGLGNYETIAPSSSYIDVMDFESIEALANFIKALDKSPPQYFRYFEWRREFNVNVGISYFSIYHCAVFRKMRNLVTALKEKNETNSHHVYGDVDLQLWFSTFYDKKLNRNCKSCLTSFEVSVVRPILNKGLCRNQSIIEILP